MLCVPQLLMGCYATTNRVKVPSIESDFPVSASRQYVDASGQIIDDSGYDELKSFSFEKTFSGPRHGASVSELKMEPELERLVRSSGGNAITKLTIRATRYDPGAHASATIWKRAGWSFGIAGATFIGLGIGLEKSPAYAVPLGASCLGVAGLAVLGLVTTASSPSSWKFRIDGAVVRQHAAASAPPAALSIAAPPTAAPPVSPGEPPLDPAPLEPSSPGKAQP